MPRPERGTPEYEEYKAQKRARRVAREREESGRDSNSLSVRGHGHDRHRSSSRRRNASESEDEFYSEDSGTSRRRPHSRAPSADARGRRADPETNGERKDAVYRGKEPPLQYTPASQPPLGPYSNAGPGQYGISDGQYSPQSPGMYAQGGSRGTDYKTADYARRTSDYAKEQEDRRSRSSMITGGSPDKKYGDLYRKDSASDRPAERPTGYSYRDYMVPLKDGPASGLPPSPISALSQDSKATGGQYAGVGPPPTPLTAGSQFTPTSARSTSGSSGPRMPASVAAKAAQEQQQKPPSSPNPFQYQTGGPTTGPYGPPPKSPGLGAAGYIRSIPGDSSKIVTIGAPPPAQSQYSGAPPPGALGAPLAGPPGAPGSIPPSQLQYGGLAPPGGGSTNRAPSPSRKAAAGLTVATNLGPAPGGQFMPSPALQPYHGTYQSISPMPSPMFGPSSPSVSAGGHVRGPSASSFSLGPPAFPRVGADSDISDIEDDIRGDRPRRRRRDSSRDRDRGRRRRSSNSDIETRTRSRSRSRTRTPPTYDPTTDAKAILAELKHTIHKPSVRPLIRILPTLTPPELFLLRREYKRIFKGVNLAKHMKAVFPTVTPFGKICFAVTLGPFESEAWFANSWYQKKETRNELLIEALMGRTNSDVRNIKAAFKDAKYGASLENAVQAELPSNKFRLAVMLQLGSERMEDDEPLTVERIRADVARLGNILERGRTGGETEMINIIVQRSDPWLREVAATYRRVYERDLAKAIIKHSRNLVGETLLHILNGAMDKPLRDAKLLDQGIRAVVEENREDLLISRSTRIHWEPEHLRRVKRAFRHKYKITVGDRLREVARGSYLEFLLRMMRED